MAAGVPGQLIWEIVKDNNSFLVKQFGRGNAKVQFSKESNNLYNVHSYKYSGLANPKTISIKPGSKEDLSVIVALNKKKKQNKPNQALQKTTMKKDLVKMSKTLKSQVGDNYYRMDLTRAALARLSVTYRFLQVSKSGVKKRNRQAHKN